MNELKLDVQFNAKNQAFLVNLNTNTDDYQVEFSDKGNQFNVEFNDVEYIQGEGGGYVYTPSVSEDGVISWTNDGGLPNPPPVNIRGPQGEQGFSGVYVGSGDMPEGYNVQIDPNGYAKNVGEENAEKLIYINSKGEVALLTLSSEFAIINGVLTLTTNNTAILGKAILGNY